MAISTPGVGSGLDVNSIVSQLMSLERRPLDMLNQQKSTYNSELSAYGTLKSDLAAIQTSIGGLNDSSGFDVFKATPSDSTLFTATADSTAIAGSHSVTVGQLAQAQKLVSASFADTGTTQLGTGSLTVSNGTSSFNVAIDSTNNTLSGIANAINANTSNFGVSATILNDGTGYRLVLSPNSTGAANAITVAVTDTGDGNNVDNAGLSRLSYVTGGSNLTQTQAAQDATLTVDGLAGITSASNTVTGVIQGVTLSLKAQGSTTVQVAVDTDALTAKANDFISAYNKLNTDITNLHQKGGALEGENSVLSIQSQINGVFNTPINIAGNAFNYLSQIGISIQKDGSLALDSATFTSALTSNIKDVTNLFTDATQGFGQRMYSTVTSMLQSNGVVQATTDGINAMISDLTARTDQMQARLDQTQIRLQAQYSQLDSLLGTMTSTSNLLLSKLGA
jgi:flagellar hook-associated protein 2